MNSDSTNEKLADFKSKLVTFLAEHEAGEIDKVWRDLADWGTVPDWVAAVLYIEEARLGKVMNVWHGDWVEVQTKFEELMQGCGIWYEMENCCVILLYDEEVMNKLLDDKTEASQCKST